MVLIAGRDNAALSLDEVLRTVVQRTWGAAAASEKAVQRAAQRAVSTGRVLGMNSAMNSARNEER